MIDAMRPYISDWTKQPRQFLPRRADREEYDVHHPLADRRRRRLQPGVDAGRGGHRQKADIAILRTLGARPLSIMTVFVIQGALVGFIGLGWASPAASRWRSTSTWSVPFIERLFGVQFLSKEVCYISDLPSDLQWATSGASR